MEPNSYQRIIGNGTGRRYHGLDFARCRGRGRGRSRGFRINSRRFSVSKLRAKFMCLLRILNGWRRKRSKPSAAEVAEFPRCADRGECRLRSFRRSNSFYAEAIADCLDFIKTKRSPLSVSVAIDEPRIEFRDPSP